MRRIRRTICILPIILLLISAAIFTAPYEEGELQAFANDGCESVSPQGSFYVQSLPCPADIMEYTSENIIRFIRSMDETKSLDYDSLKIGHPFTYGNKVPMFTFPVYSGNKVVYTFRVGYDPDGSISGTASTFLVDELNAYRNRTSQDSPLLFDFVNNTLYACFSDTTEEVFVFPDWDDADSETFSSKYSKYTASELEILDIAAPIDISEADQAEPIASIVEKMQAAIENPR